MKNILNRTYIFCFVLLLIGCTKHTTSYDDITTTIPTGVTTQPSIKFFNVMDYGATNVFLNSKQVSSVAKFYASNYIAAKEGINNIQIAFPNKNTLLNVNPILALNTKYSCFFYKVGYDWKYSLVKDDLPTNLTSGAAALRVLDFRTEAYYNYINVRLVSPGSDIFDQKNRNFLDHNTYESYTQFKTIGSGTYNVFMYNDTITSSYSKAVSIDSKGIYSVVLTTPINIIPYTDAIFYIFPDVVKHN
jgi:hypothetical protein